MMGPDNKKAGKNSLPAEFVRFVGCTGFEPVTPTLSR